MTLKKHTYISLSDVVKLLRLRIRDYHNEQRLLIYGPDAKLLHELNVDVRRFFATLMDEMFTSKLGDARNLGQLLHSEHHLQAMGIDERTAHEMTEEVFEAVVNTVGTLMPDVTFHNSTHYQFGMMEYDLLVTRPPFPLEPPERSQ